MEVAQSCPTLCDPRDYTVHGILQTRILEWVASPSPGDLPNPGIEPRSPALQIDSLPVEPPGQGLRRSRDFPDYNVKWLGATEVKANGSSWVGQGGGVIALLCSRNTEEMPDKCRMLAGGKGSLGSHQLEVAHQPKPQRSVEKQGPGAA